MCDANNYVKIFNIMFYFAPNSYKNQIKKIDLEDITLEVTNLYYEMMWLCNQDNETWVLKG